MKKDYDHHTIHENIFTNYTHTNGVSGPVGDHTDYKGTKQRLKKLVDNIFGHIFPQPVVVKSKQTKRNHRSQR